MKDAISNVKAETAIVPAVKTAAENGESIDTQGFRSLAFVINTGAVAGDGDFGAKVQESADGTDWTDTDADNVQGILPATLAADSAYRVGYSGSKRYARLALTKGGGTSIVLSAVAVLGQPAIAPMA